MIFLKILKLNNLKHLRIMISCLSNGFDELINYDLFTYIKICRLKLKHDNQFHLVNVCKYSL